MSKQDTMQDDLAADGEKIIAQARLDLKTSKPVPIDLSSTIAIDLGAAYCRVGVNLGNEVKILPNRQGNLATPSYVAFKGTETLVGELARDQAHDNPANTIFNVKKLIGRKLADDQALQDTVKGLPYKVVETDGKLAINVTFKSKDQTFTPEQILAILIKEMKEIGELFLGKTVTSAIVTVPPYFNASYKEAGRLAGLNVARLVLEPIAAATTFTQNFDESSTEFIAMLDVGSSVAQAAAMTYEEGIIELLGSASDTKLGGEVFDSDIASYLARLFEEKHGVTVTNDTRAMRKLIGAAEKAKRTLSSQDDTSVDVEALYNDLDFSETLTRRTLEDITRHFVRPLFGLLEKSLQESRLTLAQVTRVIFCGGSAHLFFLPEEVKKSFKCELEPMAPDTSMAVIQGATVMIPAAPDLVLENVDEADFPDEEPAKPVEQSIEIIEEE